MGELSAEETGDRLQFSAGRLFLKHPLCPALGMLDSLSLCSMKSSEVAAQGDKQMSKVISGLDEYFEQTHKHTDQGRVTL